VPINHGIEVARELVFWHAWPDSSESLLNLVGHRFPVFSDGNAVSRQLSSILQYVADRGASQLCIESDYVDRDFGDDHSAYYSKCLHPYSSFCHRIHFFSPGDLPAKTALEQLSNRRHDETDLAWGLRCREFSQSRYLGYCVIRPLPGSPVGRTVLRWAGLGASHAAVRTYRVHLGGIELEVHGLAFQEQDLGVSACATTALWSALQPLEVKVGLAHLTCAQITSLGLKNPMLIGQTHPAIGLALDQMARAVMMAGAIPMLIPVKSGLILQFFLSLALQSGFVPVLQVNRSRTSVRIADDVDVDPSTEFHAVAVVSSCQGDIWFTRDFLPNQPLKTLFIHDDRYGPYRRADVVNTQGMYRIRTATTCRDFDCDIDQDEASEEWSVQAILIPLPLKLRLPAADLLDIVEQIFRIAESLAPAMKKSRVNVYFASPHEYFAKLMAEQFAPLANRIAARVSLPRHAAIISLASDDQATFDFVIDTTDTRLNVRCLAIAAKEHVDTARASTASILKILATRFQLETDSVFDLAIAGPAR
jgi:hypothetical protein